MMTPETHSQFRIASVPEKPFCYQGLDSSSPVDRRRLACLVEYWSTKSIAHSIYNENNSNTDLVYIVNAASDLKTTERLLARRDRPAVVLGVTEDVLTADWAGTRSPLTDVQDIAKRHFYPPNSGREFAKRAAEVIGLHKTHKRRMMRVISKADAVICASEAQAASLRFINPFCMAVAEAIPASDFKPQMPASKQVIDLAKHKNAENAIFILWEGTAWGLTLIETIQQELEALHLNSALPVRLVVSMPPERPRPLHGITDNAEILARRFRMPTTFVPWDASVIGDLIRICDIGIAPMPILNPFYAAKAHNKPAVYMSLGLPVVASDIPAYRHLISDGVDGMIARDGNEWLRCLELLSSDPHLRSTLGKAGKATFDRKCATPIVAERFLTVFRLALSVAEARR
jgi:hypothetical protein